MRLSRLALLGILILAPMSAYAQGDGGGVGFGGAICEGAVPCTPTLEDTPRVVANANACVSHHFGFRGTAFDPQSASLDSNCLQGSHASGGTSTGLTMSASCCVVPSVNNTCSLECNLTGSH